VWIWELQPGNDFECVAVLNGHSQDVKCVTWHPTEDVLVSTSYDDTIKIWTEDPDGDDWSCSKTLSKEDGGHESTVWCASFEPGGAHRVVTCSDDRTIAVWNAAGARARFVVVARSLRRRRFVFALRFFSRPLASHRFVRCWSDGRVERAPHALGST
jgi:WD40 repeat protein